MLIPWWLIVMVPLTTIAIKLRGGSEKPNHSEIDGNGINKNPLSPKGALVLFGFVLLLILSPLMLTDSFIHFIEWLQFNALSDLGQAVFGIQPRKPPTDSIMLFV